MITILRLYQEVDGKEVCIREPKEIVRILSNPTNEIDLDFKKGGLVMIGSSTDFIGQIVKIGDDLELEIPKH